MYNMNYVFTGGVLHWPVRNARSYKPDWLQNEAGLWVPQNKHRCFSSQFLLASGLRAVKLSNGDARIQWNPLPCAYFRLSLSTKGCVLVYAACFSDVSFLFAY